MKKRERNKGAGIFIVGRVEVSAWGFRVGWGATGVPMLREKDSPAAGGGRRGRSFLLTWDEERVGTWV